MTILSHRCLTWNRDTYKCIHLRLHQKVNQLTKRWHEVSENFEVDWVKFSKVFHYLDSLLQGFVNLLVVLV